jgi:hypothetical protein
VPPDLRIREAARNLREYLIEPLRPRRMAICRLPAPRAARARNDTQSAPTSATAGVPDHRGPGSPGEISNGFLSCDNSGLPDVC